MRIVPSKQVPAVRHPVQLVIVWKATCTRAPVRHPATTTPSEQGRAVTPVVPPWMSAVKECSPTWTS